MGSDPIAGGPAVEASGISKSFGGAQALDGAAVAVARGEIHALVGANGSGKSTLVKVLSGHRAPDPGGRLAVDGTAVELPLSPRRARELGLRFVHQELGLIESLSAAENLRLEELATGRRGWISWSRERRRARESFARIGLDIDPRSPVAELAPVERALLALARATEEAPTLLALDEPTSFLPATERGCVYELLRALARAGAGVLLVSHDLGEVTELADRVTVLRDGRVAGTFDGGGGWLPELLGAGEGRPTEHGSRTGRPGAGACLSILGLTGERVRDLSIELGRGELLGLTGLAGSGFEELPYLVFGARRARAGRLVLDGEHDLTTMTPARAIRAGVALVSSEPGVPSLPVEDNVTLPLLDRHRRTGPAGRAGAVRRAGLRAAAGTILRDHDVSPATPATSFGALSGGNRQKALVGRWLATDPALLLLDEPLRGVDASARLRLAERIRALASDGSAVICSSADPEQLTTLCDRVLTISEGRLAGAA